MQDLTEAWPFQTTGSSRARHEGRTSVILGLFQKGGHAKETTRRPLPSREAPR